MRLTLPQDCSVRILKRRTQGRRFSTENKMMLAVDNQMLFDYFVQFRVTVKVVFILL
jgi:hypothetical protein